MQRLLYCALAASAVLATDNTTHAQYEREGMELYLRISLNAFESPCANDCWGYVSPSGREYALAGLRMTTAVVDVTNPYDPVIIAEIPHTATLRTDIKTYQHYAYVSNGQGGGLNIIDLSQVDDGIVTQLPSLTVFDRCSNIFVNEDSGFLYTAGASNGSELRAYSLADPTQPVAAGVVSAGSFCHDVQVVSYDTSPYAGREIAFACEPSIGLRIYDVTDKNNMFPMSTTSYPDRVYCNQGWLSEDRQYFYLNDKFDEINRTTIVDVSSLESPFVAADVPTDLNTSDSNGYVVGDLLFEAEYTGGIRVYDITDPLAPTVAGWIDTYPNLDAEGPIGAESVYPFLPSGVILAIDSLNGLFLLRAGTSIIEITYPNGRPETLDTSGATVTVRLDQLESDAIQSGTERLHVFDGTVWIESPLTAEGDDVYTGHFPELPCNAIVQWYVSVEGVDGYAYTSPPGAPESSFSSLSAAHVIELASEDFEFAPGWTVENVDVTDGAWDEIPGIPVNFGRGDPPADFDGSSRCYLTDNIGGDSDLEGGPTRLMSPTYDLSIAPNIHMLVATWITSHRWDDQMIIEVRGADGDWIMLDEIAQASRWQRGLYAIPAMTDTSAVQFRFSVSDNLNDSITEAAIDAFRIVAAACPSSCDVTGDNIFDVSDLLEVLGSWGPCAGCPADLNADGAVNVSDLLAVLGAWGPCTP